MTKKSKQIILDAVTVIAAHELDQWNSICNAHQVILPGTVIENELFYFGSEKKIPLRPSSWIKEKKVTRIDALIEDYQKVSQKLSDNFLLSIDRGEREALAILLSDTSRFYFTTSDIAPIKALGALNLGSRGISLEEILEVIGKNIKKPPLSVQYTKKWFQQKVSEGFRDSLIYLKSPKK